MTDRHDLDWQTVLDRLELDLVLAERKLADPDAPDPEPWSEPHLAGPIPGALLDRARTLLSRQQVLRDTLAVAALALRRQEQLTVRLDRAATPRVTSVYLDVDA